MPIATNNPIQENKSTFLGLRSYTEANSNAFFGRDNEIDATTALIQLNPLTIVFGRSGTGKTSLLNAGVFPKLRKNYCLPFRIRLEFNHGSPDLVTQVKNVLKKEIDNYGFNVQTYPGEETLWEYFHKELLWVSITPILVFDQFEEIFTLAKTHPRWTNEMPAFWEELSDLIENNIPKKLEYQFLNHRDQIAYNYKTQRTKIVFAFREEYLPEFETIASKIPSLKYSRFRLLPMNGHQAYEVITKTWKENINPSEARHIVSYFTNEPGLDDYSLLTVEPSLLSQVCAYIDKERIESGGGKVSAELLKKYPKETILRSIYDEAVTASNDSLKLSQGANAGRNLMKEFVEEKLISSQGYRIKYNLGASDEMLKPGINVLAAKYFIREDDNTVELIHDVLAPIIKIDREKRRKEIERIAYRKKVIKRALRWIIPLLLIAGAMFAFLSYKSRVAERELKKFEYAIKFKKDSLEKEFLETHPAGQTKIIKVHGKDSVVYLKDRSQFDSLNKQITDLIKDTLAKHYRIEDLESEISKLNLERLLLKDSLSKKAAEIKILVRDTAILKETIHIDRIIISNKTKDYDDLKKKYNDLQSAYDKLLAKYNDLVNKEKTIRKDIADSIRVVQYPPSPCPTIDTKNSLQLAIYYTKNEKYHPGVVPEKINIYLIPYNDANTQVIRKAKVYDYYTFNETALQNAKGSKRALYCNGTYYFSNVTPGRYLVKVCTLYGAYKDIKIEKGNERFVIDAVPPIR
jgi:hypothetical protein